MNAEQLLKELRQNKQAKSSDILKALLDAFERGMKVAEQTDLVDLDPDYPEDRLESNADYTEAAWHAVLQTVKVFIHYADKKDFSHARRAFLDLASELDNAAYWTGRAKTVQDIM
jgi:hypothetical protein